MSRNVFGLVYEPGKPLSISIPVREFIKSLFNEGFFFESGNCKRVTVTSPAVGKILEHFRIMEQQFLFIVLAIASRLYK